MCTEVPFKIISFHPSRAGVDHCTVILFQNLDCHYSQLQRKKVTELLLSEMEKCQLHYLDSFQEQMQHYSLQYLPKSFSLSNIRLFKYSTSEFRVGMVLFSQLLMLKTLLCYCTSNCKMCSSSSQLSNKIP